MGSDGQGELRLAGHRVLVVGASAGIGRAVAVAAAAAGASVAIASRRVDLLREVAAGAPAEVRERFVPIQVDVRAETSVGLMGATASQVLGGLDTVVYSAAVTHLAPLSQTTAEDWRRVLDTNLVGAALVARSTVPLLAERDGGRRHRSRVAFLSSHSVADPWPGLGAYVASKAALDEMVAVWALEHPEVAFTRVVVGPTITGMADGWDPARAEEYFTRWAAEGRFDRHEPRPPEIVAGRIVEWMHADPVPAVLDLTDPDRPRSVTTDLTTMPGLPPDRPRPGREHT